jgi:hypothetical protein
VSSGGKFYSTTASVVQSTQHPRLPHYDTANGVASAPEENHKSLSEIKEFSKSAITNTVATGGGNLRHRFGEIAIHTTA